MRPVLTLVTPPSGEVVTLEEAKSQLRVTTTAEDDLIRDMVAAAVERFDARRGILGRALLTQEWAASWAGGQVAGFGRDLRLPFPPVQEILAVEYLDPAGATVTWDAGDYVLMADEDTAALVLQPWADWPAVADRDGALTVTFRCGYGAGADVPARLRRAILADVASMYRVRESLGEPLSPSPFYVETVAAYRVAEGLT